MNDKYIVKKDPKTNEVIAFAPNERANTGNIICYYIKDHKVYCSEAALAYYDSLETNISEKEKNDLLRILQPA